MEAIQVIQDQESEIATLKSSSTRNLPGKGVSNDPESTVIRFTANGRQYEVDESLIDGA